MEDLPSRNIIKVYDSCGREWVSFFLSGANVWVHGQHWIFHIIGKPLRAMLSGSHSFNGRLGSMMREKCNLDQGILCHQTLCPGKRTIHVEGEDLAKKLICEGTTIETHRGSHSYVECRARRLYTCHQNHRHILGLCWEPSSCFCYTFKSQEWYQQKARLLVLWDEDHAFRQFPNKNQAKEKRAPQCAPKCKNGFHWVKDCRYKTNKDGQPLKYHQQNPTLIVMGKQKVTPTIQSVSIGQNQTRMRLKLENTIFECIRDTG